MHRDRSPSLLLTGHLLLKLLLPAALLSPGHCCRHGILPAWVLALCRQLQRSAAVCSVPCGAIPGWGLPPGFCFLRISFDKLVLTLGRLFAFQLLDVRSS